MRPLRIGTRSSALAMAQAREVAERIKSASGARCKLVEFSTAGDRRLDLDLSHEGFAGGALDKGMFTRELEVALAEGGIDLAVHSLKDLPTRLPRGLMIGAVLPRGDPADVLVHPGRSARKSWKGKCIATGSLRRRRQIEALYPGVRTIGLRGNVPTRLRKAAQSEGGIDAVVLAAAGLSRLGFAVRRGDMEYEGVALWIEPLGDRMAHAVGQGVIAIQCRRGERELQPLLRAVDHRPTRLAVFAERALLSELGGGCQMPLAVVSRLSAGRVHLRAELYPADGGEPARGEGEEPAHKRRILAQSIARQLEPARITYENR